MKNEVAASLRRIAAQTQSESPDAAKALSLAADYIVSLEDSLTHARQNVATALDTTRMLLDDIPKIVEAVLR